MIIRQGEVRFQPIKSIPECSTTPVKESSGVIVVGESESHHHHVLEAGGCSVMERTSDVPEGMKVLYAVVEKATKLKQSAGGNPHGEHIIEPGTYEIHIKREYDPFSEQARRVAD